jgi:putative hydrolase
MYGRSSMKLFADYHTHTIYSHGKGTIRENVEVAIKKGLKEIAITDHGPGHATYGVKKGTLRRMREEIDELNKEFKEIKILLGVEANLISCDGNIDVSTEDIEMVDKLLVGFHNGAIPYSLRDAHKLYFRNYISGTLKFMRKRCIACNTDAMIRAIEKYNIDIITHPGAKIDIDIKRLAAAAGKKGTVLEINSSHGNLTIEYAKIAMMEDVKFVINSDAHIPPNVGNFEMGIKIAEDAGIPLYRIVNAVI